MNRRKIPNEGHQATCTKEKNRGDGFRVEFNVITIVFCFYLVLASRFHFALTSLDRSLPIESTGAREGKEGNNKRHWRKENPKTHLLAGAAQHQPPSGKWEVSGQVKSTESESEVETKSNCHQI